MTSRLTCSTSSAIDRSAQGPRPVRTGGRAPPRPERARPRSSRRRPRRAARSPRPPDPRSPSPRSRRADRRSGRRCGPRSRRRSGARAATRSWCLAVGRLGEGEVDGEVAPARPDRGVDAAASADVPAAGSQRYSSSPTPSRRGRSWCRQCQSSWSTSRSARCWVVVVMPPGWQHCRTDTDLCRRQTGGMSPTAGLLQLLGLLQSRPVWPGPELARQLGVTERSVRRDVERLRELGYPVEAGKGISGGYRLGAGCAHPRSCSTPRRRWRSRSACVSRPAARLPVSARPRSAP